MKPLVSPEQDSKPHTADWHSDTLHELLEVLHDNCELGEGSDSNKQIKLNTLKINVIRWLMEMKQIDFTSAQIVGKFGFNLGSKQLDDELEIVVQKLFSDKSTQLNYASILQNIKPQTYDFLKQKMSSENQVMTKIVEKTRSILEKTLTHASRVRITVSSDESDSGDSIVEIDKENRKVKKQEPMDRSLRKTTKKQKEAMVDAYQYDDEVVVIDDEPMAKRAKHVETRVNSSHFSRPSPARIPMNGTGEGERLSAYHKNYYMNSNGVSSTNEIQYIPMGEELDRRRYSEKDEVRIIHPPRPPTPMKRKQEQSPPIVWYDGPSTSTYDFGDESEVPVITLSSAVSSPGTTEECVPEEEPLRPSHLTNETDDVDIRLDEYYDIDANKTPSPTLSSDVGGIISRRACEGANTIAPADPAVFEDISYLPNSSDQNSFNLVPMGEDEEKDVLGLIAASVSEDDDDEITFMGITRASSLPAGKLAKSSKKEIEETKNDYPIYKSTSVAVTTLDSEKAKQLETTKKTEVLPEEPTTSAADRSEWR